MSKFVEQFLRAVFQHPDIDPATIVQVKHQAQKIEAGLEELIKKNPLAPQRLHLCDEIMRAGWCAQAAWDPVSDTIVVTHKDGRQARAPSQVILDGAPHLKERVTQVIDRGLLDEVLFEMEKDDGGEA